MHGSARRVDMSLGDQLRQQAAMGGARERAELASFEALRKSERKRRRTELTC